MELADDVGNKSILEDNQTVIQLPEHVLIPHGSQSVGSSGLQAKMPKAPSGEKSTRADFEAPTESETVRKQLEEIRLNAIKRTNRHRRSK